jgi:hypothetical protein
MGPIAKPARYFLHSAPDKFFFDVEEDYLFSYGSQQMGDARTHCAGANDSDLFTDHGFSFSGLLIGIGARCLTITALLRFSFFPAVLPPGRQCVPEV